ncbi:hypothetical protein BJF78_06165 [Pseudonocardia sp. CNS-139]|nr:hypothetical protein BJF78_06165 [Pseudonocardia sp. CNS-139]
MPRTRPASLLAVLASLLVGLLVAGCSTVVTGQASPAAGAVAESVPDDASGSGPGVLSAPEAATPSPAGIAWADQVCGAFLDANVTLTDQPLPDAANPAGTVAGYSQYFDRTVPALDAALGRLQGVGPGPLDGGGTMIANMTTLITLMRDGHVAAKAAVDAIDPASPTALTQELPAALALTDVQDQAPPIDVGATAELNAAAEAAPMCRAYAEGG